MKEQEATAPMTMKRLSANNFNNHNFAASFF